MTGPAMANHSDQDVGAAIGDAAARTGLGRHRQTYLPVPPRNGGYLVLLVLSIAGLIGAVISFAVAQPVVGILCVIAPIVMLPALIRSYRYARSYAGARLDLYDAGLVAARQGRLWVARYDSTTIYQSIVRHMRNNHHIGTTYTYTFTDIAGVNFVIGDGISNPQEWGPSIQRAVTETQLPQALAALQAGHRLVFGELWMTWYEVGSTRKSAPWTQVNQVAISDGRLSVDVAGRWFALTSAMVRDIPNFLVFEALAEHLRRVHGGAPR
ncbi:DUF6585 family protein [Nocardia spumae]|uniref:DUF6585 family protein n=1 Tax=Nocardia spumae TaxID=2887190 RepID=UPI001D15477E|nr:DUF6585 family protein [Nocardia spumae]